MPAYYDLSSEELRHQDYLNGRTGIVSGSATPPILAPTDDQLISEAGASIEAISESASTSTMNDIITVADVAQPADGSQKVVEASNLEKDASLQSTGQCKRAHVAIGVICPCCGVLACAPKDIFTEDDRGFRPEMFCGVRSC